MTILGREPVAWIGIIVAIVISVLQTAAGEGLISDALKGEAINATNALAQVATIFVPIIVGIIATRRVVTPTAAPALPQGTSVTVITPGDAPNTTTTL